MINASGPRVNLYNFFSVLLPGTIFVLALVPFFPSGTEIDPLIGIVPLLAGGFVFGQAIHSLAVIWQSRTPRRTHREQFQELLKGKPIQKYKDVDSVEPSAQLIGDNLLKRFYQLCSVDFDEVELEGFEQRKNNPEQDLEDLYTLVRGVVHFDGRGRSRTFQAIYAFCRSMWVLSIVLWIFYYTYATILFFDIPSIIGNQLNSGSNASIIYTPLLAEYVPSPEMVFILSTTLFLSSHKMFRSATDEYKEYFTEYLVADYLLLNEESTSK